jgi:hypothetical protein
VKPHESAGKRKDLAILTTGMKTQNGVPVAGT